MTRHLMLAAGAMLLLLSGCGAGLNPDLDVRMAVPRSILYDGARANFAAAIIPGSATGASTFLGDNNAAFRDALKTSLYINGLLAADEKDAQYRVDLELHFDTSNPFGPQEVATTARYRLISLRTNEILLDRTFQTGSNHAPANAHPIILPTIQQQIATGWENAWESSVRNNIVLFLTTLSYMQPPRSAAASP